MTTCRLSFNARTTSSSFALHHLLGLLIGIWSCLWPELAFGQDQYEKGQDPYEKSIFHITAEHGSGPSATLRLGTGFLISEDGQLATAYHVVQGAHSVSIRPLKGEPFADISIVSYDAERDLIVLRAPGAANRKPFRIVELPPDASSHKATAVGLAGGGPEKVHRLPVDFTTNDLMAGSEYYVGGHKVFPNVPIDIVTFWGAGVSGMSGAPITINDSVVAIVGGGPREKKNGVNWGLPAMALRHGMTTPDSPDVSADFLALPPLKTTTHNSAALLYSLEQLHTPAHESMGMPDGRHDGAALGLQLRVRRSTADSDAPICSGERFHLDVRSQAAGLLRIYSLDDQGRLALVLDGYPLAARWQPVGRKGRQAPDVGPWAAVKAGGQFFHLIGVAIPFGSSTSFGDNEISTPNCLTRPHHGFHVDRFPRQTSFHILSFPVAEPGTFDCIESSQAEIAEREFSRKYPPCQSK